jgi:hypothetical protein
MIRLKASESLLDKVRIKAVGYLAPAETMGPARSLEQYMSSLASEAEINILISTLPPLPKDL